MALGKVLAEWGRSGVGAWPPSPRSAVRTISAARSRQRWPGKSTPRRNTWPTSWLPGTACTACTHRPATPSSRHTTPGWNPCSTTPTPPTRSFAGIPLEQPEALFTPRFLDGDAQPDRLIPRGAAGGGLHRRLAPGGASHLLCRQRRRDVPIANAAHAQETLASHGATSVLVDIGDVDHTTSVVLSLPLVLDQFAAMD